MRAARLQKAVREMKQTEEIVEESESVPGLAKSETDQAAASKEIDEPETPIKIQRLVYSCPVDHSGTTVYVKGWRLPNAAGRPVVIVHDLGEEIGIYRSAAIKICESGSNCYGFDLRGHGRSGRRLGHISNFSVLIHDLLQVVAWVRHKENGANPIVLGQGVGALIALSFVRQFPKYGEGIILSAPCLELSAKVSPAARMIMRVVAEILPTARLPQKLTPIFTAHSQQAKGRHARITANFVNEVYLALTTNDRTLFDVAGEMLILCPTEDTVCRYGALKKAVAVHTGSNITVCDIEGASHHLFTNEDDRQEEALAALLSWIKKKFPPQVPPAES